MTRALATLTAVCAVALAGAGPAAADSLVFVKDHNVWLANPDGSGQYQVTSDGTADNPWISPSQADDGTIVAARHWPNGGPLYRMRQNGEVINEIPLQGMIAGPFSPQVSPDGSTVAYHHTFSRVVNGYLETSSDVRFTRTDGSTPDGFGQEVGRGAGDPSWIDSNRALVGVNALAFTMVPGEPATEWWSDYDHQPTYFDFGEDLEDGEFAAGRLLVPRGDRDDNTLVLYRSAGDFTTPPTPLCMWSNPPDGPNGRQFDDPTFSPAGDAAAWEAGDGIYRSPLPANDDCPAMNEQLIVPGGSQPDWGPADVNPGQRGPVCCAPEVEQRLELSLPKRAGMRAALRSGVAVKVAVPGAGNVTASARSGRKKVAAGKTASKAAGTVKVRVRFSRAAVRSLRRKRNVRLALKVSYRSADGGTALTEGGTLRLTGARAAGAAAAERMPPVEHSTTCSMDTPKQYRLGAVLRRGFPATITCDGPANVTAHVEITEHSRKVSDYIANAYPDRAPGVPARSPYKELSHRLDEAGTIKVRMKLFPYARPILKRFAPFPVEVSLDIQTADEAWWTLETVKRPLRG
jgi:hypothetical protein